LLIEHGTTGTVTGSVGTVSTDAQLRIAIANAANGDTIRLANGITLTADLPVIQTNITIDGKSNKGDWFALGGAGQFRGLFVGAWTPGGSTQVPVNVTIQNLTFDHLKAQGGSGGTRAGGGAGLGGGLFVAKNATVTVSNVLFDGNSALGGIGGMTFV